MPQQDIWLGFDYRTEKISSPPPSDVISSEALTVGPQQAGDPLADQQQAWCEPAE